MARKNPKQEEATFVDESDQASMLTLQLLNELGFDTDDYSRQVGVRLWNGTLWPDNTLRPVTLVLNRPGALRQMFLSGTELGLAEAYLYDDFDIEGNVEVAFGLAETLNEQALVLQSEFGEMACVVTSAGPKLMGDSGQFCPPQKGAIGDSQGDLEQVRL